MNRNMIKELLIEYRKLVLYSAPNAFRDFQGASFCNTKCDEIDNAIASLEQNDDVCNGCRNEIKKYPMQSNNCNLCGRKMREDLYEQREK